jgi:hypothetical protein
VSTDCAIGILLSADRSDFLAFFGATFTGVGTFLAMFHIVFPAFFATVATNLGTETTDFLREVGTSGHEQGSGATDGSAIAIKRDAAYHHFNVLFLQAGVGAVGAFGGAFVTGFNACLIFLVWHISPLRFTLEI